MKLQGSQVGGPDEGWQVLRDAVLHPSMIAFAPDGGGWDPLGTVAGTVLLIEKHIADAVWIALKCQRPSGKMRNKDRRDADVIVDDLSLCES